MKKSLTTFLLLSVFCCVFLSCQEEQKQAEITINPDDYEYYSILEPLDNVIGDAQFICFGESSHVLTDIHKYANEMFRYLVERHGVRVFVLESAWGVDEVMSNFINSDRETEESWESYYMNIFGTHHTMKSILYIREHNSKYPDDPIYVAGYQPEQPVFDYAKIREYLSKADLTVPEEINTTLKSQVFADQEFANDLELISVNGKKRRAGERVMTDEQLDSSLAAMNKLDEFIKENKAAIVASSSENIYAETLLHVFSMRSYVDILIRLSDQRPTDPEEINVLTNKVYEKGDAARFHIFRTLLKTRYAGKRMFLWMHDWHAAKRAPEVSFLETPLPGGGAPSLGTHLFNEYGEDYVVIGNITGYQGDQRTEREDALDVALSKVFGDIPTFIDLRAIPEEFASLPLNENGAIYVHHARGYFHDLNLKRQFDALVYLPHSGFTYEENK